MSPTDTPRVTHCANFTRRVATTAMRPMLMAETASATSSVGGFRDDAQLAEDEFLLVDLLDVRDAVAVLVQLVVLGGRLASHLVRAVEFTERQLRVVETDDAVRLDDAAHRVKKFPPKKTNTAKEQGRGWSGREGGSAARDETASRGRVTRRASQRRETRRATRRDTRRGRRRTRGRSVGVARRERRLERTESSEGGEQILRGGTAGASPRRTAGTPTTRRGTARSRTRRFRRRRRRGSPCRGRGG